MKNKILYSIHRNRICKHYKAVIGNRRYDGSLCTDYIINDGKIHPVAILCPGGGYSAVCSFIEGVPIAEILNKIGISVAILYYRVKEDAIFPNPQDDLAHAIAHLMQNQDEYNIDMTNYSIWGFSAGGHLAASFGTDEWGYKKYSLPKPECLVLAYPVISLREELTHKDTRENHIGKTPTEEMIYLGSANENVGKDYPETFLWCSEADKTVKYQNSVLMAEALSKADVHHKIIIYPNVPHGAGPAKYTSAYGWIDEAVGFWLDNQQKAK